MARAGLRFQLLDRHPWSLHAGSLAFVPVQVLLVTPLLALALLQAAWVTGWKQRPACAAQWRFLGLFGAFVLAGLFVLGFFADSERVGFPLAGAGLPGLAAGHGDGAAWLVATVAEGGLDAGGAGPAGGDGRLPGRIGAGLAPGQRRFQATRAISPAGSRWRRRCARSWRRCRRAPGCWPRTCKVGAELGFALGDPRIAVLDHPLNHAHGRAPQLRLWGLQADAAAADVPTLLVLAPGDLPFKHWLQRYPTCARDWGRCHRPAAR